MNPTKSNNSGEVPIHNLFGLVERYLDLDQTDGPHRCYYGWDDLVETIPRTVFKARSKSGQAIKIQKLLFLQWNFLFGAVPHTHSVKLDKYEHPDPHWQEIFGSKRFLKFVIFHKKCHHSFWSGKSRLSRKIDHFETALTID